MNQTSKFSVRDICYAGLFAAVIAVMAQISIPMPLGVPMTMQTFAITLAAVVLGSKLSAIATLVYLLLGAVGVPVLANFSGGIDKFVGPTGGFLISFPINSRTSTRPLVSLVCLLVLPLSPTARIRPLPILEALRLGIGACVCRCP